MPLQIIETMLSPRKKSSFLEQVTPLPWISRSGIKIKSECTELETEIVYLKIKLQIHYRR